MPEQATALDMMLAQQLPGMGEHALPAPCDDEELERLPVHTAARIRDSEPARYALAVALFFGERMGVRQICRYARMSPHTLQAIILAESAGRTAEQWRNDLLERMRVGGTLAASALTGLLMDEEAVQYAGIKGVATALREYAHAHELMSGRPTDRREVQAATSDDDAARAYLAKITPAMDSEGKNKVGSRGVEVDAEAINGEVLHD